MISRATIALGILLVASPALAQVSEADRQRARNYFDAGAQAYEAGAYGAAAEAFMEAYALVPNPALLFSAAQAYRRQQLLTPSRKNLDRAIRLYRQYLSAKGTLKRRDDAMKGLEDLVAMESRTPALPEEVPDEGPATRLLLTAAAEGARISVDGAPFVAAPLVIETEPGPHEVRVEAPNHRPTEVTVTAVDGELVPQAVELVPRPARLKVVGSSGELHVDGQLLADAPTEVSIEPGERFVSVVRAGYAPYQTTASFERGAGYTLEVELTPTPQRVSSWSLMGIGGAAVLTGGALATYAFIRQADAIELRDARTAGNTSTDDLAAYRDAVSDRDDFMTAGAITGGIGAAAVLTGGLIYAFEPTPRVLPPDEAGPEGDGDVDFTIGVAPVVAPGVGWLSVQGTF